MVQSISKSALKSFWEGSSGRFKVAAILCVLWVAFNSAWFVYGTINPIPTSQSTRDTALIGSDYRFYLQSGANLQQHASLYDTQSNPLPAEVFRYHPVFALVANLFNYLPAGFATSLWYLFLVAGYLGGVILWLHLFSRTGRVQWGTIGFIVLIPVIAYDWFGTLGFGNVGPGLVLLSGLLMWGILERRPVLSGLLTAILVMIKFYWCFPLIILIVFKEWRLLLRILLAAILFYAGITALYLLATGDLNYGLSTLRDYFVYLATASSRQKWYGVEAMFNTANNGIYQTILRYFGFSSAASLISGAIQLLLVIFVLWQIRRAWQAKVSRDSHLEYAFLTVCSFYVVLALLAPEVNDGLFSGVFTALLFMVGVSRFWARAYVPIAFAEIPAFIGFATGIQWLVLPATFPLVTIGFILLLAGSFQAVSHLQPETSQGELTHQVQIA